MRKTETIIYQNVYLGMSDTEIKKIWDSLWVKLFDAKTLEEMEEIRREMSKCEESFYAEDCGDFWWVETIPDERKRSKVYKVMKEN